MARPLLLSAGSRGDIEPLLALTDALSSSPKVENTLLFQQRDYMNLVPSLPRLDAVALPFAVSDMMPSFARALKLATPTTPPFEAQWCALGHATKEIVLPFLPLVLQAATAAKVNVVLSTTITWPIASAVADSLAIPLLLLTLQPDLPSAHVPHPCLRPLQAAAAMHDLQRGVATQPLPEYTESYAKLHAIALREFLPAFNKARCAMQLKPFTEDGARDLVDGNAEVTVLVGVSTRLAPPPPDAPQRAVHVGALAPAYRPRSTQPPPRALCEFLQDSAPPFVVSFGSMWAPNGAALLTRAVLGGMRDAGVKRAVMLRGTAGIGIDALDEKEDRELVAWARECVLVLEEKVQFAWLMPKAAALVCHGGAGAVSAALYAGIPVVVVPDKFDQPFYADLLSRMRVGAGAGSLADVQSEDIARAVGVVMREEVRDNATRFGELERAAESPVTRAVDILTQLASDGVKTENV